MIAGGTDERSNSQLYFNLWVYGSIVLVLLGILLVFAVLLDWFFDDVLVVVLPITLVPALYVLIGRNVIRRSKALLVGGMVIYGLGFFASLFLLFATLVDGGRLILLLFWLIPMVMLFGAGPILGYLGWNASGGREWSGLVIDDVREERGERYVVLRNASGETVDLSEASITDGTGNRFRFAEGFTLAADESETFHVHESFAPDPDSTFTLTTRDGKKYEIR